ncbi:MAG: hypothetical protein NC307_02565 [Roseburia sp.]|nr:hypothetical protein [Roseburia sp.]
MGIIGFIICSMVTVIFLAIGISCRKSQETVGFFTFVKPPRVKDVMRYNRAVSTLWLVSAVIFEILSLQVLFFRQNSPVFLFMVPGVIVLVIAMMIAYIRIENKYRE